MENKINSAAQAIVDEVNSLAANGRYPRRGWKFDASAQLEDAKTTNSVAACNAIKGAYCAWCKKCNHNLCMDGAPVPCRFARTYRRRLAVLMECEYAEANKNMVKVAKAEPSRKYAHSSLYELKKAVKIEHKKLYEMAKGADWAYLAHTAELVSEGNFGALKDYMKSEGHLKTGPRKDLYGAYDKALTTLIKEVLR